MVTAELVRCLESSAAGGTDPLRVGACMQRSGRSWKRLMKRWTTRRSGLRQDAILAQPQASGQPLGVVKLVLSSVELLEQPMGAYFCVLKCACNQDQFVGLTGTNG